MSHIFVSYSRKNQENAQQVVDRLRGEGFVVWQDISNIRGGDVWLTAIRQGIQDCDAMVLLWSAQAKESRFVQDEIDHALFKNKVIVPIFLDDTPADDSFAKYHGFPLDELHRVLESLPKANRRKALGFDPAKAFNKENYPDAETWQVDYDGGSITLMSVRLFNSSYCEAAVIAPLNSVIHQPKALHLALQFSQKVGKVFLSDVYRNYRLSGIESPFVSLAITGPLNFKGEHSLDNQNNAQWLDAVDTTKEAVEKLAHSQRPDLHLYALGPSVLLFALGMNFWRFWNVSLYNWVGGEGEAKYRLVLKMRAEK